MSKEIKDQDNQAKSSNQLALISNSSVSAYNNMMLPIFQNQCNERVNIDPENISVEMKLLQIMIDNGGSIVVDLESFSQFYSVTLDEAKSIQSLCKSMSVEEAMLKFIELNSGAFISNDNSQDNIENNDN